MNRVIIIAIGLMFLVGCVKAPFFYPGTEIGMEQEMRRNESAKSITVNKFTDSRSDKKIDKSLKKHPLDTMRVILQNELSSMSCVKAIELKNDSSDQTTTDLFLDLTIKELKWKVPDYKQKVAASAGMGFAFGLIGGLACSSRKTDVHGFITLHYQIKNSDSVLVKKTIEEMITIQERLMNCDTRKTKARVIGLVYEKAIQKIKKEISAIAETKNMSLKFELFFIG